MSQLIKTNKIYGKVAKIFNGIITKFCCLRTLYNVSSIFNLNVSSFSKIQAFCLKVSIYWSYWLNLFNIGTKCTSVMPQFVIIALICNTCPNLKYILPQFAIAALFCNNGCPFLYAQKSLDGILLLLKCF